MDVRRETHEHVTTVILDRPTVRNAIDRPTAEALAEAFRAVDADPQAHVAVLWGAGGTFCAGADLKAIADGRANRVEPDGDGPLGPTRFVLGKPVIAAIEGFAVAGGLELACWCDLRVAASDATLGVFCRRWGVPLIDGGTVRLPQIVGLGRAMELVLTGRPIAAAEALAWGLLNRVVDPGQARAAAEAWAAELAGLPQTCLRSDRQGLLEAFGGPGEDLLRRELLRGLQTLGSGESLDGASRFVGGAGRHGR